MSGRGNARAHGRANRSAVAPTRVLSRILAVAALAASGAVFATESLAGTTETWTGNTSTAWNTATNWSTAVPVAGDDVILTAPTGKSAPSNQNSATVALNSVTLDTATDNTTFNNGYSISGTAIGLASGGVLRDNAQNLAADTISTGLTLNGPASIVVASGSGGLVMNGAITGTGPLTTQNLAGAGKLVLLGASTYSGGTTVTAGTLQLGNGTTNGTIQGNTSVASGATLVFDPGVGGTSSSGVISGLGGVELIGPNRTALTGANTYTGGTTIDTNATLWIGDLANAGSIVGNVVNNGGPTGGLAFVNTTTSPYVFSGNISGNGFIEIGTGENVVLTGANTDSGNTFIDTGAIFQIGNATTPGSTSTTSNISDNGQLIFNNVTGGFQGVAGNITGTGSLEVDGGTSPNGNLVILTGAANTWSGGTIINAGGTLQIGTIATAGSIVGTGAITDNGTLNLAKVTGGTITLSGLISGSGRLIVGAPGSPTTVVLTHADTYSGGTSIVSGSTLQIGDNANAGGIVGDVSISSSGLLDFHNVGGTTTFAGKIQGAGNVQVDSGSDVILTAANGWTGTTTINSGGTLELGNGGTTGGIGLNAITDNGTFVLNESGPLALSNNISGSGGLTQQGSGTTTLVGTTTYTGLTTVNGGTLVLTNGVLAGDATIASGANLTFQGNAPSVSYAGAITGLGSFSQLGNGTVVLTGTGNTYSGGTTIGGLSTLQIGDATHTGSLPLSGAVTDNGKLSFVNLGGGTTTFSGVIGGTGKVDVNLTSGTLALTGTNTYSGGTIVEGGTLAIGSSANIGGLTGGPVSFANGATLQFTGGDTFGQGMSLGTGGGTLDTNGNTDTWSGLITGGTNGLTKTGAGTLILTNNETYTGDTTVSGGTLQLGNGTTNGNLASNIVDNATVDFDEIGTLLYGGVISGSGVVEQVGAGTLTLSGTNTYTGGTNVNSGTLSVSSDANLGNGGTVALAAGTTLKTTATGTFTHDVTLVGDPTFNVASGTTTTWSGLISDGGAPPGVLEVSGGGTFVPTNTGNSYSGGTVVHHASTIVIDATGELGAATGGVTLGNATTGGTLDAAASMTLEPTRTVSVAAGGGTINTESGFTFEIGQGIGGAGALTVTGPGTLILAGTSTYAGGTNISGGNLQLGDGTNPGSIAGNVTDNGSLVFDQGGNAAFSGLISGNGSLTQNDTAAGTLTLTGADTYTGGTTITSGTLQLGDGTTAGSLTGNITDNATLAFDEPTDTTLTGNIAGTGGVTQSGTGKIILTGTNSYTGPTVINAASTLQIGIGSTAGTLSAASAVTDNGTLAFDESGTLDIGNAIGGTGGVSQIGTGTTQLSGTNTYTGPTLISGGTLSIGDGGATGSIDPGSAVTDNGTLAFNETGGLTFANAVSGSGGLSQLGSGTTALTGTNTNAGTTLISQGVLSIGNGGTAGSLGAGGVTDNGTLAFNHSDDIVFANAVSGSGGLHLIGSGKVTLTGANTETGTTTISAGSLQVGNGGTTGTLTGNVADGTNLAFDRSDTLTYGGAISGTGSVSQIGTGTTILLGANTYTGGTTISAGTLSIGNGGATGAITGNVANAGTLEFDRTGTFTFGGVISGAGTVLQAGVGTTELTAAQTYTGPTQVTSGTLIVDNSIASSSSLSVSGGGTIAGIGTLPKTTIANGGTIAPGISGTGTLTINGPLVLGAGSTYAAVITPTTSDLVKVLGTATLQGALTVTPTGTGFTGTPIPILTADGGISGKFTTFNIIAPPSSVIPILTYDANDAFLSFIPSVISLLPTTSAHTNQANVANAIDFALVHDGAADFAAVASLSGAQLEQTLSEMSGEEGIAFQSSALLSMRGFLDRLLDPMVGGRGGLASGTGMPQVAQAGAYEQLADNEPNSEIPVEHSSLRGVKLWADGFGFQNTTDADAKLGTHKTSATQMGGEVGVNYTPEYGNGALGAALGVNSNRWDLASNLGKGQATAYQVGVYYSRGFDKSYFSAAFSYAFYNASTLRTLHLAGTNVYHAAFDAQSEAGSAEFGHIFDTDDGGQVGPYLRLAADDLGIGKYSETTVSGNPNFGLSYVGKQHFDYTSELGGFYRTLIDHESDSATVLNAKLGWLHDYAHSLNNTATFTAFPGASFTVNGAPPPQDSAHLLLGIEHDMNQFALSLSGEGAFSGSAKTYGGTASVSYRW